MPPLDPTLQEIASRARDLYTLPAVAIKVLELTSSEEVDTRCLKLCIENDPALTTKILKVVNSSLFGLSREVKDLNQALALLGTKPLKLLVLGFSLPEQLFEGDSTEALGRYWRLSLTKAVAARQVSETFWDRAGDDAFIAGLLEDIGLLVLLRDIGDPYQKFLDRTAEIGSDLCAAEAEILHFDHCQLSGKVLAQWNLPEALTSAIARPRSSEALLTMPSEEAYLPRVLHLADLIAQLVAWNRLSVLPELLECGQRFCQLDKSKLTDLVQDMEEKVDSLSDVLSLDLPEGTAYAQVLANAHAQLAQVASDVVGDLLLSSAESSSTAPDVASDHRILLEARELAAAARRLAVEPASCDLPKQSDTSRSGQAPSADGGLAPQEVAVATATEHPSQELLINQLGHAVADGRQQRTELSLLLAEVDSLDRLATTCGPAVANELVELLEVSYQPIADPTATVVSHADGRLAIILPNVDRRQALEHGNTLIRLLSDQVEQSLSDSHSMPTLSVGIASIAAIPKNFPPTDLLEAAQRCLYGAQTCGGNSVKSIEI